ncbi:MAG: iron-containing alcohol dehydrogenase [Deltaproteobacteria bacterium]|nr:iron-containing alcohol dehydrogenase [Deltaproteobacteria bacterium]
MTSIFNIPSTIIVGGGASKEVGVQTKKYEARRILLVTGPYMVNSGLAGRISDILKQEGIAVTLFGDVEPDPTDRNVADGLAAFKGDDCEAIVGLGGGSSMDCAKAISIMTANEMPISQYAGINSVPNKGAPVIAIPTTAGTGAEVTKVAIIGDTERDVKMMILDVNILPDCALVDYQLTMSCPPDLTANVGIDTLVHAVEAYVSVKANPLTDPIALSSIRLISENLLRAFNEPDNQKAREGMTMASLQGGMAFANSSVCLVHGMSRPIGALYHVPHGLSNAVLFPAVTEFSISGSPQRYAVIARAMGYASENDPDNAACSALVEGLKKFNEALKIPHLGDVVGIDLKTFDQRVEKMANDGIASGSPNNNPVVPTAEQIVELYHQAW